MTKRRGILAGLVILAALLIIIPSIVMLLRLRPEPEPVVTAPAEKTIKLLEGWTLRDVADYLDKQDIFRAEDFLDVAGYPLVDYRKGSDHPKLENFASSYSFLDDKPSYRGLEGYLFPDTYRIYASSTPKEVIKKLLSNFDSKLTPQMRQDIKKQGKSIYEIITLASIVEKEAPLNNQTDDTDAKIIAGIFLNRLRIGQGLQSDATLSYIFGDNDPAHSGETLKVDSPYNTYKYRGLPPGPICNPGILAIKAAIYPTKTDYNYFLTTPDGKVVYARTHDEHVRNKAKYLR